MKRKALAKLAKYLISLKEKDNKLDRCFNLRTWDCGTSACAIGHAILAGIAPKGLKLTLDSDDSAVEVKYKNYISFAAVSKAYGINYEETKYLFSSLEYKGNVRPKTVGKRIAKCLQENA